MNVAVIVTGVHLSCAAVLALWWVWDSRRTPVPLPVRTPGQELYADGFGRGQIPDPVSQDIWLVLSVSQDSPSLSELSRRTGCSEQDLSLVLSWMLSDGRVVQDGAGYRLRLADRDPV